MTTPQHIQAPPSPLAGGNRSGSANVSYLPGTDQTGVDFSWARYAATRLKQIGLANSAATLRCFVPNTI